MRSLGSPVEFAPGDRVMSAGDAGDTLFVILDGSMVVERPGVSLTLGVGDLVGEIGTLDGGPRTADVTAVTGVQALVVQRHDLLHALESDPAAALALIEVLAGRLRGRSG